MSWTSIPIAPEIAPSHTTGVYDSTLDCLITFGGQPGSYEGVDELHLSPTPGWSILRASGPPSRTDHASVLDPVRHRFLVIGGSGQSDVWAFALDGTSQWTQLTTAGETPGGWSGHSAIYDAIRDRVVVFGGARPGTQSSNELWALDLAGQPTWHRITAAGGTPTPRRDHSAIYDPVHDRMIVYAGDAIAGLLGDLWALTLSDPPVWNALSPASPLPLPRYGHAAVFDPVHDRMLVASGRTTGGVPMNDVWALGLGDTLAWSKLVADNNSQPAGRTQAALCYDSRRNQFLFYGGQDNGTARHDVWKLGNGSSVSWTSYQPDWGTGPTGASIATDRATGRVFALSGTDFWVANLGAGQAAWKRLAPVGPQIYPRSTASVVFDSRRNRVIVFGGSSPYSNDVWSLGLDEGSTWQRLFPGGTPPLARSESSALYDSLRDRIVIFGGRGLRDAPPYPGVVTGLTFGDAFSLSLSGVPQWSPLSSGPSSRTMASVAYDPTRNHMLLYGGGAFEGSFFLVAKNDLWQFDLTSDTWLQLPADPNAPSSRWAGIMAVDTALDELAVVGGQSFNTPLSDANAFALDSNHWIPLPAAPANLMNGSAFVDPFTHRLTVIGGIWMQSGVFAYEQTLPARPTLHLTGPDPAPWTAGSVVPLSFHAASQPAGNQIVDYAVSSNRAWPGLPFNGFVASNGNATIDIGIPVPDTAAGDAIIHVVARLRDDPAAADSADAILLDPSAVTTERLSLRNAGPDTLLLAPGSASNLRVLAQVAAAGPRTVEIVASGSAEVSGLPLTHSYVVLDSATISIPIAIPDSAVSSTVTVHVVARLASNAEAADSTDLHLRIQRAPASAVVMGSTTTLTEVRIRWQVSDRTSTFWIERRVGEGLWESLASVKPTSTGAVLLRDTEIRPGTHYEYGLTEGDPGNPILAPVAIDVPQVVFALHGAFPNPVNGEMAIHMDLLEGSPAQVDLFDISGRRVRSAKLASPLSGPQELRWPTSGLRPGVYVIRLAQSGRSISTRVTVMR